MYEKQSAKQSLLLNEERLEKLQSLNLLDTVAEPAFDRLTRLASEILDVPVSLVSLVDADRLFFKSHVGLPEPWASERETPLSHSFCQHILGTNIPLVIEDTRLHDSLRDNLAIPDLNVIAYIGIPLTTSDGYSLGAFCAIDSKPRHWTERDIRILGDLAATVMEQIETRAASIRLEIQLRDELLAHQKTEINLQASDEKFRQVAESANDAIIVLNENARVDYVNPRTCEIFGYTEAELLNMPLDTLTQAASSPELESFSMSHYSFTSETASWKSIRLVGQHKDGSEIPIEITFGQFLYQDDNWSTLVIREISDRVVLENTLRDNEARYLQILDAIPDIVFVKESGSRLVWANQAMQAYYNMSLEELIAEVDAAQVDEKMIEQYLTGDKTVFEQGVSHLIPEEPMMRHDGVVKYFTTAKTPIFDNEDNAILLVGISRDITDSRNLERYLTEALEKNQELTELKSSFTSMVSHEFRTPLAVILSSAEIILNYFDRLTDERRQNKLLVIKEQVKYLTRMMDEVLMLSRGDTMGLPFNPTWHDVHALAFSIVEDIRMTHAASEVSIDYGYEACDDLANIDDNLFRHIFQNLLSNAVKYSKPNSKVKVRLNCADNQLTLVVTDEGIGIPEENQANLYQTFHRANNVGTIQGTGLGLAIVKRAVDTHGGIINFKSIENQGTMFIVQLPLVNPNSGEE